MCWEFKGSCGIGGLKCIRWSLFLNGLQAIVLLDQGLDKQGSRAIMLVEPNRVAASTFKVGGNCPAVDPTSQPTFPVTCAEYKLSTSPSLQLLRGPILLSEWWLTTD